MDFLALLWIVIVSLEIDTDFGQTATLPAQGLESTAFFQRLVALDQLQLHVYSGSKLRGQTIVPCVKPVPRNA